MWFDKKKEDKKDLSNLPDLPELPELPEVESQQYKPSASENLPSLPAFPNSDTANRMSREAIKSAFTPEKTKLTQEIESPGRERWMEEREEGINSREEFNISPISTLPSSPRTQEKSPIFVRIDKFQAATKTINEIRKQISDIESALSDIRSLKSKEEEELTEWEQEILGIKAKIDSVDKALFSKLE